jgi:hypothetical protein
MRYMMLVLGVLLILSGAAALAYKEIEYKGEEKVFEAGPFSAKVEEKKSLRVPPIVGWLCVGGGIALAIAGARRK